MVMAALTALKSTNDDFWHIFLLWLIVMNETIQELNRIHRPCYGSCEKSGDGRTCRIRQGLRSEDNSPVLPLCQMGENKSFCNTDWSAKRNKPWPRFNWEQASRSDFTRAALVVTVRTRKQGIREVPLVNFLRPGCFVGEQFTVERCLD